MKVTSTRTREVQVVEDYVCNKCGASCRVDGEVGAIPEHRAYEGLIEASVSGGYHGREIPDLTTFTFSVCGPCLVEFWASFKHPPRTGDPEDSYKIEVGRDGRHHLVFNPPF
jgi:hypothetical protein